MLQLFTASITGMQLPEDLAVHVQAVITASARATENLARVNSLIATCREIAHRGPGPLGLRTYQRRGARRRSRLSESAISSEIAIHTSAKPASRSGGKGSWNTATPIPI